MDRRQMVVQRAREYFGDRLEDVLHMVRQDLQELHGRQEPAHLRTTIRRTVRQEGSTAEATQDLTATETLDAAAPFEMARNAAEPNPGQQREALGQLLEFASRSLEKVARNLYDLTPEEIFGLETTLLLYGRPALLVNQNRLASPPPFWNILADQSEDIEIVQRGVGRIELFGHPEFDWAGTGFLVGDNLLLTTRRCAELFAENQNGNWQFRPGISAWMDYRSVQNVATAGFRVRSIIRTHPNYDLAMLEVESTQVNGAAPLSLAAEPPPRFDGLPVYLIGYPVRDTRRNESELVSRIFRDVYGVKRVQPGVLRGEFWFSNLPLLRHDCAPLGQTGGSPIVDIETHQVIGMQLTSRYLETSTAVPLYALRNDPFFQQSGVTFTGRTRQQETEQTVQQLERLVRSRFWNELRGTIQNFYQRAFGSNESMAAVASAKTACADSDDDIVHFAIDRLPPRALAGLTARYARRLLPFVSVFANTVPGGATQFFAVEAALRGVECFAAGGTVPSQLAGLAQIVRSLLDVAPGLGEGEANERAYICLFNSCAALALVLEYEEKNRIDLWTGFRACFFELSSLANLAKATVEDAKRLLNSGIDLSEGLSKLRADPSLQPIGALWPEGEPDWYQRESAQMSRIMEKQVDELQKRLDCQVEIINERTQANDAALSALAAKEHGELLTYEEFQGEVVDVSNDKVVVQLDTNDDIIEQTYEINQFNLGRTPEVGDQLTVYVHVAVVPQPPVSDTKGEPHESPRHRRNVITGDHRF